MLEVEERGACRTGRCWPEGGREVELRPTLLASAEGTVDDWLELGTTGCEMDAEIALRARLADVNDMVRRKEGFLRGCRGFGAVLALERLLYSSRVKSRWSSSSNHRKLS